MESGNGRLEERVPVDPGFAFSGEDSEAFRQELERGRRGVAGTTTEGRIAALMTARLGLAKAERQCKEVVEQVRQSMQIYRMAERQLDSLAAELVLASLEQSCRDLSALQERTGRVRGGE